MVHVSGFAPLFDFGCGSWRLVRFGYWVIEGSFKLVNVPWDF